MKRSAALFLLVPFVAIVFSSVADAQPVIDKNCRKSDCFVPVVRISDRDVSLLGVGHFEYFFLDVYSAGLYAPKEWRNGEFSTDVPSQLEIVYYRDIEAKDLVKSANETLAKQNATLPEDVRDGIAKMNGAFRNVSAGDRYTLRYEPQKGTTLYFNREPQITVPGENFAKVYFRIWLDRKEPLSEDVRRELFGGES